MTSHPLTKCKSPIKTLERLFNNWITIVSNCTAGVRVMAVRAVKVDGEEMMVTMDYRTDRVNVEIRDSVIVGIRKIG